MNREVGMKPLSERDENFCYSVACLHDKRAVGMKPLSERDENNLSCLEPNFYFLTGRNEATL